MISFGQIYGYIYFRRYWKLIYFLLVFVKICLRDYIYNHNKLSHVRYTSISELANELWCDFKLTNFNKLLKILLIHFNFLISSSHSEGYQLALFIRFLILFLKALPLRKLDTNILIPHHFCTQRQLFWKLSKFLLVMQFFQSKTACSYQCEVFRIFFFPPLTYPILTLHFESILMLKSL